MNTIRNLKNKAKENINKQVNLVKSVVSNPNKFIGNLFYGHSELPYSFREMLNTCSNVKIYALEIIRNPLNKALSMLLSSFTGFQLEQQLKKQNYDSLFHLKIRINNQIDFEKEQSVQLRHKQDNQGQEVLRITTIPNLTIGEFIENTIKFMGLHKFLSYDGLRNNCQHFVLSALHANHIEDQTYDAFVKQNTEEIFKSTPSLLKKLMNTTTDIANRMDILQEGTGLSVKKAPDALSNYDLFDICKKLHIPLKNVIMKDQLTKKNFKNGCYIMNLENHNQGGSHWTAFIKKGDSVFYCDSYGVYPPQNEWNLFKSCCNVYVNLKQYQPMKSERCGYYATYFLWFMTHISNEPLLNRFKMFLKVWDYKKLSNNDKVKNIILSKYNNE